MSNSKNYNRMVFLTTLSVYLGLVLVGATPPVLAQTTATQKVIEIQSDEKLESFAQTLITFVEDLKKLESIGKYNPATDWEFQVSCAFEQSLTCKHPGRNRWLDAAALELAESYRKVFRGFGKVDFELRGYKPGIELKFKFSNKNASDNSFLVERFRQTFSPAKENLQAVKLIYENANVFTENNQVFIVTRLPRASIDALLAERVAK